MLCLRGLPRKRPIRWTLCRPHHPMVKRRRNSNWKPTNPMFEMQSWKKWFDTGLICFHELLILAETEAVSRFLPEIERGSGDINAVSSTHVECVLQMTRKSNWLLLIAQGVHGYVQNVPHYYSLLFKFCSEVVHDLTINTCDNNWHITKRCIR